MGMTSQLAAGLVSLATQGAPDFDVFDSAVSASNTVVEHASRRAPALPRHATERDFGQIVRAHKVNVVPTHAEADPLKIVSRAWLGDSAQPVQVTSGRPNKPAAPVLSEPVLSGSEAQAGMSLADITGLLCGGLCCFLPALTGLVWTLWSIDKPKREINKFMEAVEVFSKKNASTGDATATAADRLKLVQAICDYCGIGLTSTPAQIKAHIERLAERSPDGWPQIKFWGVGGSSIRIDNYHIAGLRALSGQMEDTLPRHYANVMERLLEVL